MLKIFFVVKMIFKFLIFFQLEQLEQSEHLKTLTREVLYLKGHLRPRTDEERAAEAEAARTER